MAEPSKTSGGTHITWGAEHRDGKGNLISRQISIDPPAPLTCPKIRCLIKFFMDNIRYGLILGYHERRITYAEANRNKKILDRYRTGEPGPRTIWQAIHAHIKLTCPVCRRYNVDPLILDKNYRKESYVIQGK